jgi:serine/threonine-protein kinase
MITPERGLVIAGKYTLVHPHASGAMGSVWIARHDTLDHLVAVKFMAERYADDADLRARFEREAKMVAGLRSQHVVHVHDYGFEDDTPYIVMELLVGESLGQRLRSEGRLTLPALAPIAIHICKGLHTAHKAGLVHRDLKPSNIFLALMDDVEVAKVLDFGVAKAAARSREHETLTQTGQPLGTAPYMSPEQYRDAGKVDHRSDLWSLGVILFQALSGRRPFPGPSEHNVMVQVCVDPVPAPSSVAADLPPDVDAFFARALARDPDQRFQSARELAEAFCSIVADAPPVQLSSRPPPPDHEPPAPTVPQPRPAPPTPAAGRFVRSDTSTLKMIRPAVMAQIQGLEPPAGRPAQSSAADDPTRLKRESEPELPTASISGTSVSDEEPAAPARLVSTPDAVSAPSRPRVRWPAWIAVAAVIAGVLGFVALRPGADAPGARVDSSAPPASVTAPAPSAPPPAPSVSATAADAPQKLPGVEAEPRPSAAPAAPALSSTTARRAAPSSSVKTPPPAKTASPVGDPLRNISP